MGQASQHHSGPGDNIGRDKHVHYYLGSEVLPRSKYLNAFARFDLANLVGRETQLRAIDEHLKQHHLLLLQGIGGIGKTTLAKAYIFQTYDQYDHIAYVEIVGSIAESMLVQLGNSPDVGLEVAPQLNPEAKFEALIDILRHIPKLLLVLDNANDAEDLRERRRQLSSLNATVLITSRARPQSFDQERNIQEIQALTPDEAQRLFIYHYTVALTETESLLVKRMLKEAFYHPKLIEVIAKVAQANAFIGLEELNQVVSKKHYEDEEINYPIEIDEQTKKIYRVLLDLFDTDPLSKDTQQTLRYFAILPTMDIPVHDLVTLLQKKSTNDRHTLLGILNNLVQTGWLDDLNNRYFSMHGLVQWVIRQRLVPTALNCRPLISGMVNALAREPTGNQLEKQRYLPYTVEWLTLFADSKDEELANALSGIASIYGTLGDHPQRLAYHQKALIIREAVLPPTHPSIAQSYNNLGLTYGALGDYPQALAYNQKAVAIQEAVLSPKHPDLADSYNNLAATYGDLGDHPQRLAYHQKALIIREAVLSSTHPNLANSYNNLAETYGALGDQHQRLAYHQKALAISKAVLSSTHPDLAQSYNNLAGTYDALGDHPQALAYHKEALAIREAVLPLTHPDLAQSYNNLAGTYYYLGELEQAHAFMQKAIKILEHSLPLEHPNLISSRRSLNYIQQVLQERNQSSG